MLLQPTFPLSKFLGGFLSCPHGPLFRREGGISNLMEPSLANSELEEVDLVQRIAGGDQNALAGLYDRFAGSLLAVAMRVLNDASAAEDVLQDVFVQIWERAATYDPSLGKPISWAVVMTRNKAIDRLRSRIRADKLVERATADLDADVFIPTGLGDGDRGDTVRAALLDLPNEQRQVIELAFFGGLSQAEIAEKLSQPLGTVKARIRRGMLKLRDDLEDIL